MKELEAVVRLNKGLLRLAEGREDGSVVGRLAGEISELQSSLAGAKEERNMAQNKVGLYSAMV